MISIKSQCIRVSTAKMKILITYSLISDGLLRDYHKLLILSNIFLSNFIFVNLVSLVSNFHMIRCIPPKRAAIRNGFPDHLISSAKISNALSRTDLPTSPSHDIIRHVNKRACEWQMILYICDHHLIDFSDPLFLVSRS